MIHVCKRGVVCGRTIKANGRPTQNREPILVWVHLQRLDWRSLADTHSVRASIHEKHMRDARAFDLKVPSRRLLDVERGPAIVAGVQVDRVKSRRRAVGPFVVAESGRGSIGVDSEASRTCIEYVKLT